MNHKMNVEKDVKKTRICITLMYKEINLFSDKPSILI